MLKTDYPSELFLEYLSAAFDLTIEAGHETTPSNLWTQMVMLTFKNKLRITSLFTWDYSRTQTHNRIKTIAEVIERNLAPGFAFDGKNLISRIHPSQVVQPLDLH